VFPLNAARVLIGRRSDADVVLSHRLTSRQHAQIAREGDSWVISDLQSTHGTWVNGERTDRHVLKARDRIRLGGAEGIEMIFLLDGSADVTTSSNLLESAGLDFSVRRLAEVLPEETGAHSELEKISCLLDFHYSFGKAFSADKTFQHIVKSALQISGAERGFVLRREKDQFAYALGLDGLGHPLNEGDFRTSRTVVDQVTRTGEPVFMTQGIQGDLAGQASIVSLNLRAVACLPLEATAQEASASTNAPAVMGILYLDSRKYMHSLSGLDEKLLTRLAGDAGHVLEKLQLVETLAERQRVEQELAVAEETQRTLLPLTLPDFAPYAICAFSRATRHLGGDFYDFIPVGSELVAILADVSGKGIPAALLSSLTLGALNMEFRTSSEPVLVLNNVNKLLCQKTPSNRFVTLCLCQLDGNGHGHFISAGHNTTFIFRGATGALDSLDSGGMPLGMFPFSTYQSADLQLEVGDVLVVYSDGLTDAENEAGDEFGEDRLRALIKSTAPQGAAALEAKILQSLDSFTQGAPQTDDITFLLIERCKAR
jgi:serine phosphatase RsbU (regulator of sigma subunit)/pSer/pThr/pTyr-binding forkhead associated (FHA) protein